MDKKPWYLSRTMWVGILMGAWQIVDVIPIPEAAVIKAIIGAIGALIGAEKARDVLAKPPQQ